MCFILTLNATFYMEFIIIISFSLFKLLFLCFLFNALDSIYNKFFFISYLLCNYYYFIASFHSKMRQ